MTETNLPKDPSSDPPEPRWPALLAALAVALLYFSLPPSLTIGPPWFPGVVVMVLAVLAMITHQRKLGKLNHIFGHLLSSSLTLFMIWSLSVLLFRLPSGKENPLRLLESAAALWVTNVLVFALWYWRLDGGGPYARDKAIGHECGAFLFPQMTQEGAERWEAPQEGRLWSPQFVDYLFLAFNTSTAFSPTDAPVLSRWAKIMMMIQSMISLAVIVLLAARGVNILGSR